MSLSPSHGLEAWFILFIVYGMAQCVMLNITEVEQWRGKQFTSLQPCRTCAAYLSAGRQRDLLSREGWEQLLAAPGGKAVGGKGTGSVLRGTGCLLNARGWLLPCKWWQKGNFPWDPEAALCIWNTQCFWYQSHQARHEERALPAKTEEGGGRFICLTQHIQNLLNACHVLIQYFVF